MYWCLGALRVPRITEMGIHLNQHMVPEPNCPLCGCAMKRLHDRWCYSCPVCATQGSTLPGLSRADLGRAKGPIDELSRQTGLRALRAENDARIVGEIARYATGRLLDVGSAYGWFLEEARRAGFEAVGVEPDVDVAATCVSRGLDVRTGFFPDVMTPDDEFDVVCFNDTLEHLPDVRATLRIVHNMLAPNGLVAINIPVQDGPIYRTARRLAKAGIDGPFRRMWQFGFSSPHIWYFSRASLLQTLMRHGFAPVRAVWLPSVSLAGIGHRVGYGGASRVASMPTAAIAAFATPILRRLSPTDNVLIIARRADRSLPCS